MNLLFTVCFFTFMFVAIVDILLISDSFEEHIKFKTSKFDPNIHDVVKKFDGFVQEHLRIVDLASTDEEYDHEEERKGKPQSEHIFYFKISHFFPFFIPNFLFNKTFKILNQILKGVKNVLISSPFWLFSNFQNLMKNCEENVKTQKISFVQNFRSCTTFL